MIVLAVIVDERSALLSFLKYFCVFLSIRAIFVIGLYAVKFARKLTPIELN
jgi:hypothetical protein